MPDSTSPEELAFQDPFGRPAPAAGPPDDYWMTAALSYPPVAAGRGAEADRELLAAPLEDSEGWLAAVVAADYHPKQALQWFALSASPVGTEVLFTGWKVDKRWLQVASMRNELHLRTQVGKLPNTEEAIVLARVMELAHELTNCSVGTLDNYWIRRDSGFLMGRSMLPSTLGWRALSFATDGTGVRLSVLKRRDSSALKGPVEPAIPTEPWFPHAKKPAPRSSKKLQPL